MSESSPDPTGGGVSGARAQRADAARNRTQITRAATQILSARPDAGVEDIARASGVGVGTLYRHFPTRDALVWTVYAVEVDALCDEAKQLLSRTSPAEALSEWLQRLTTYLAAKRGMAAALRAVLEIDKERFDDARAKVRATAATLLDAGVAVGSIRDDVSPNDLLRAVAALCLDTDSPAGRARNRVLVSVFAQGLRTPQPAPANPTIETDTSKRRPGPTGTHA